MDFTTQKEVNILGFSGLYLSLLFESLSANHFNGRINVIMNDKLMRSPGSFETNINYEILLFSNYIIPPNENFIFCSNKPGTKKFLMDFFIKEWNIDKFRFTNLSHPSSVIASSVKHENALYVEPLVVISPYSQIGFGVTLNRSCSIGHHNRIHDYVSIHSGSHLSGNVEIGEGTTIGPGCTIFNDIKIGRNSTIGGGSVITKDIPDNVMAFGNPCTIIKKLN